MVGLLPDGFGKGGVENGVNCMRCYPVFVFLKVGFLCSRRKKGITITEWSLFACSRSYQLLTGHIRNSVQVPSPTAALQTLFWHWRFVCQGLWFYFCIKNWGCALEHLKASLSNPLRSCHLWIYPTLLKLTYILSLSHLLIVIIIIYSYFNTYMCIIFFADVLILFFSFFPLSL